MSEPIVVPPLGESLLEASVGQWLKQVGERVRAGEPVVELETEKVNLEVAAPADGVLAEIAKASGETVRAGEVLGMLAAAAEPATAPPAPEEAASAAPAPVTPPQEEPVARATPAVRRLAAEQAVALDQVSGSGPKGRIRREDVLAAAQHSAAAPVAPPPPAPLSPPSEAVGARPEQRIPMSRRRLTIARRLLEAQTTAAILTTFNEIDCSAILAVRGRQRERLAEREGVRLGIMSFFTRATVAALKRFPRLNAEVRGDAMVLKQYYDIGIAVATDEGLVVPVVRDADRRSLVELEREIARLAERARTGSLTPDDLEGGTFTITNGGVFGSLFSTPILNPPQVGILGMHAIQERPVAINGQLEIRPMMYVALSYDHRIVDGSEAVRFLVTIKQLLEEPERLLVEG